MHSPATHLPDKFKLNKMQSVPSDARPKSSEISASLSAIQLRLHDDSRLLPERKSKQRYSNVNKNEISNNAIFLLGG